MFNPVRLGVFGTIVAAVALAWIWLRERLHLLRYPGLWGDRRWRREQHPGNPGKADARPQRNERDA